MLFAYAKQNRSNCTADQHLCFCYIDSTIPLLPKSLAIFVTVQTGLYGAWSETPKTGFLMTWLLYNSKVSNVAVTLKYQIKDRSGNVANGRTEIVRNSVYNTVIFLSIRQK